MTKEPNASHPRYTKAERKAEPIIDKFLAGISPRPSMSIFDQLRQLSAD